MENAKIACYDCKKELEDGLTLVYDDSGKKITVYKCKECYKKNTSLSNFRKCEVYSRIVGYIRPVGQWHIGKKQEYSERKEYKQNI
ncbi:MAG: hypothetical protein A2365_02930 [Candidatus Nealsonbacteria bacterium RIFOXYB1_FULL_40_15]|uniref:Uncharacterized protein n=2 Tax=Candidatus Nealsoniibacteriota TaxID=1817911 RepID=A0A1G2ESE4_9BACT|nr:MAG: hypothetical protein A2365_02930 [Candidatus Nealsonbacteria bacterium RIFOXYB1_FULL_40_15]OGZ28452.1 MAG: hypothetical protein A2427_02555 [Candidatus Nealsonbacteria bacterium RIFOXYC1_FULL_40_7]OGZ29863.1 MAG: hypothetical protein A2562_01965 [Candidatus Nealsonbacteria bacterium RIFOXYD1_FULL_39_11]